MEKTVRLSTMKDANFEPGQFVQLLGKKGMVKLDKNSVKALAKWIRSNSGKHGMGWSFTEGGPGSGRQKDIAADKKRKHYKKGTKLRTKKRMKVRGEGKLNEAKTLTLPNGVKAKIDFNGITFIGGRGKPVFLDRGELHKFFQATTKYLRYA